MVCVLCVAVGHYWQSVRMLVKLLFLTNAVNRSIVAEIVHTQRQSALYLNSLQRFQVGGIDDHSFVIDKSLPTWV